MGWLSPHIADKRYRLSLLALHHPCWMSRLMWLGVYLQDIQYITNYFRLGRQLGNSIPVYCAQYNQNPESVCLSFALVYLRIAFCVRPCSSACLIVCSSIFQVTEIQCITHNGFGASTDLLQLRKRVEHFLPDRTETFPGLTRLG